MNAKDLPGRIVRIRSYYPHEWPNIRYGAWDDDKDGHYIVPNYLSGSDYSGGLVERSNYEVFEETFAEGHDVWWTHTPGGHGTFGVIIDCSKVPESVEKELTEFLNALEQYPCIDDEHHSRMEMEAQDDAWDNWARRDFISLLEKKFDVELSDDKEDNAEWGEVFENACNAANVYWANEQGDSMWIDLKRVVEKVNLEDIAAIIVPEQL